MEINAKTINLTAAVRSAENPEQAAARAAAHAGLRDMEIIKALITDMRGDNITVRLPSGETLTAILAGNTEARIGDAMRFIFHNSGGEIRLEPAATPEDAPRLKMMTEMLRLAGYKINDENLNLVSLLIDNKSAVTGETLRQMNRAVRLFGGDSDKAVFFFNNANAVTPANAAALDGLLTGGFKINAALEGIIDRILDIRDPAVKNYILEAMLVTGRDTSATPAGNSPQAFINETPRGVNQSPNPQTEGAGQNASRAPAGPDIPGPARIVHTINNDNAANDLNPARPAVNETTFVNNPEIVKPAQNEMLPRETETAAAKIILNERAVNIPALSRKETKILFMKRFMIEPRLFNAGEFSKNIAEIKSALERARELIPATEPRLSAEIKTVGDTLNFMPQIKETVYVQIPLLINDRNATGELYVFKNKGKKNTPEGGTSALIALDTAFLGRFEVYLVKDKNNVSCRFRLRDLSVTETVRENIQMLKDDLTNRGYNLSGISFREQAENFDLLAKEPDSDEENAPEPVRYIFDART